MARCASYAVADITFFNRQQQRLATETGCILFKLPTRGLFLYTFQVRLQSRNCSQEWTTL